MGPTSRALEEMLRRLGWLAAALDRAALGQTIAATDAEKTTAPHDENDADEWANPTGDRRVKYTLTKNALSIGGDYTITDQSGTKVYLVAGKFRIFAEAFSLRDVHKNVLFTGREQAWNLDQKFVISRDDMAYATMLREMVSGHRNILGSATYRYVVTLATGEKLEANAPNSAFTSHWKLRWRDATVADVETDGEVSEISLASDAHDVPFVLTVVMAVVRLNQPSRTGSTVD